jgi:hypothetical protein
MGHDEALWNSVVISITVMAGLDPAIHRFFKEDGYAGQARV